MPRHFLTLLLLLAGCTALPALAAAQIDIPGPVGSGAFGANVTVLPNGNFVVTDPNYSIPGFANIGAVYLYDGATLKIISTLTGSTANDQVGNFGVVVLTNGNFVVRSNNWNNGAATFAGAATWGSATTGVSGIVSSANSLIGGTANDRVSGNGVFALTNGNYVVDSPTWNIPMGSATVGAATWGDGTRGVTGLITAANSLVGGTAGDQVGATGVTALTNGNYVVASPNWSVPVGNTQVGAATWGNGATGTVGTVSSANSLTGVTSNDFVGIGGAAMLTNGNYVVVSRFWNIPAGNMAVGAVTWGNGTSGTIGTVTSANSLTGVLAGDSVGNGLVKALTNGNYVVASPSWQNASGAATSAGAVTWANGSAPTAATVSANNSLVGSTLNDNVGSGFVTALTNGNYVVASPLWNIPAGATLVGAATWGNGAGGTTGLITIGNSLIGGTANDKVGNQGVAALTNGNYVVASGLWNIPAGAASVGAATWGNGATGIVGQISSGNSLIGVLANDSVGNGRVTALTNGNYVVASFFWQNAVGAATWGNGATGTFGTVTSSNSLIGGTASDTVGSSGARALTNGNYVVQSPFWNNTNPVAASAGAATWANGAGPSSGVVTANNSLVGGTANDRVGVFVLALTNGNYVLQSNSWTNPTMPPIANAGAVSFGFGNGGTSGLITPANSVLGTATNGVSSFSFDYFRGRLFVGRAASNIVTIFGTQIAVQSLTATPNPAGVNQTITFTAAATGGFGSLTYSWDFGDSSPAATGSSVTHAYAAAGAYTVTVTSTDSASITASSTIQVTINPPVVGAGSDTDGDGFSDSFETAVGTDPNSAASSPSGQPVTAASIQTLTISKASIKLNFAKPGLDSLSWNGPITVPAGFTPNGSKTYFIAGGVIKSLTLTDKGSGVTNSDSVKIALKSKKGVVSANPAAKYSITFKNGSFAPTLAAVGLTNADAKKATVMVPFTFLFNNTVYQTTQTMSYTAKKGKTGAAK